MSDYEQEPINGIIRSNGSSNGLRYDGGQADSGDLASDVQEYVGIFSRRWRVLVGTAIFVLLAGMVYTFFQRPVYESTATVLVNSSKPMMGLGMDKIPMLSDISALTQNRSVDTVVEIMSSRDLLEGAFYNMDAASRKASFGCVKYTKLPDWVVKISPKRNTDVIDIKVRAYKPESAASMANKIAKDYFDRDLEQNNQTVKQARKYTEDKIESVKRQMTRANVRLAQFQRRTGLVAPDAQLTKVAENMAAMQMELTKATAEVDASKKELLSMEEQLATEQPNVTANTTISQNPQFAEALRRIDQLQSDRASLLEEYTPKSDEVRTIDNRIKDEEKRLKKLAQNIVSTRVNALNPVRQELLVNYAKSLAAEASGKAKAKALKEQLDSSLADIKALPEQERQLSELMMQSAALKRSYETLSDKYYTLLFSEQAMLPNGRLVSRARISEKPAYPSKAKNALLLLFLGGLLGVLAATIAERMDTRIHDPESAEQLAGCATLAVVPDAGRDLPAIIADVDTRSPLLESFRILRNNITFAGIGRSISVLGITSAGIGEGKSTACVNLAKAMAIDGRRVVLVDCDLRHPVAHVLLNKTSNTGFTNVVMGTCDLKKAVTQTEVEGLYFLATGPLPPSPAEILNSESSRKVFRELAESFDTVIVDCPCISGLGDVQVLSTIVDGILLVVTMNQTERPLLRHAVHMLNRVAAPLLGLIANRVDGRNRHGYYDHRPLGDGAQYKRGRGKAGVR